MAGDIDHLADEIKTGHFAALHALGGEFVSADAASGDLSFSIAFSASRNNLPIVGAALKLVKRVIAPACRRIEIEPAIGQPVGQSGPESSLCGREITAGFGFTKSCGQFTIGSEIQFNQSSRFPIGRDLQDSRAAEAAMSDQHLLAKALALGAGDNFCGDTGKIAQLAAVV